MEQEVPEVTHAQKTQQLAFLIKTKIRTVVHVGVDQEVPEVTCAQKTQRLACLIIIQGGCSTCPPNNTINKHALSLDIRLSLFSEVSYVSQFLFYQTTTRAYKIFYIIIHSKYLFFKHI